MFSDVNVISIGANCLPKVVLTRWGLMRSREAGGLTFPLDLCLTSDDGALRTVISDFANLYDPRHLSVEAGTDWIRNDVIDAVFNHEPGPEWRAHGYARLRARYAQRAARFRKVLANGKQSVFVYCSHTNFTDTTRELLIEVTERLGAKSRAGVSVLAIVTGKTETDLSSQGRMRIMNHPLPEPSYIFHQPESYLSAAGVEFERRIILEVSALAA